MQAGNCTHATSIFGLDSGQSRQYRENVPGPRHALLESRRELYYVPVLSILDDKQNRAYFKLSGKFLRP